MKNNVNLPENDPELDLPGTSGKGRQNIFKTPENYFELLPIQISDRIQSGKSVRETTAAFVFSKLHLITTLGIVACLIAGGIFYLNLSNSGSKSEQILSSDDLINAGIVTEIDENILIEEYAELSTTSQESQKVAQNISLEDYLIENNTDITLIINEL